MIVGYSVGVVALLWATLLPPVSWESAPAWRAVAVYWGLLIGAAAGAAAGWLAARLSARAGMRE